MHPKNITVIGAGNYSVEVDYNSDNEIQYFQLVDPATDEIFFECDWEGPLSVDDILKLINKENEHDAGIENIDTTTEDNAGTIKNGESEEESLIKQFDFRFPDYVDYPDEFKVERMETVLSFSGESQEFHNILVSEAAEDWDEEYI